MNNSTAVLDPPAEPKPNWQCRHDDCSQPVFGNVAYCTACAILFGPYDVLMANHNITEWIPEEHLVEDPPEPERKPAPRKRTKAKPDAG